MTFSLNTPYGLPPHAYEVLAKALQAAAESVGIGRGISTQRSGQELLA